MGRPVQVARRRPSPRQIPQRANPVIPRTASPLRRCSSNWSIAWAGTTWGMRSLSAASRLIPASLRACGFCGERPGPEQRLRICPAFGPRWRLRLRHVALPDCVEAVRPALLFFVVGWIELSCERRFFAGAQSPRIDAMHGLARLIAAAVFACTSLSSTEVPAAVTYYFNWYCPGCSMVGSGSNGREGPFGSQSACEHARASMGGSLNARGCGPDCFYPQLCQSEGTPDAPPAARQSPGFPPPSIQSPPLPSYGVSGRRRAAQAQREREEAAREAQARSGKEPPSATRPDLAVRWRNAFSWYEVRKSARSTKAFRSNGPRAMGRCT